MQAAAKQTWQQFNVMKSAQLTILTDMPCVSEIIRCCFEENLDHNLQLIASLGIWELIDSLDTYKIATQPSFIFSLPERLSPNTTFF